MKNQNQYPPYMIKPKYIFKHPFLKFDLQNPTNRQAQNEELTEYFNYGFNQDTMNVYAKLVNRMIKVLDHKKNLQYFDQPSELMRLNDQIPMDFGGFSKFYDPTLIQSNIIPSEDKLFENFICHCVKASLQRAEYPMIEFVKSMYKKQTSEQGDETSNLCEFVDQIGNHLEKKYEETMIKLIEQKNKPKQTNFQKFKKPFKKNPNNPHYPKQNESQTERQVKIQKQVKIQQAKYQTKYQKKQDKKSQKFQKRRSKTSQKKDKNKQKKLKPSKKRRSSSSQSSSSSSSSGTSSSGSYSSSSESEQGRRRRKSKGDNRKSRQKKHSSDKRKDKERSDRGKSYRDKKQDKKQKSSRRQKSRSQRDNKKDRHRSRSRDNKKKNR